MNDERFVERITKILEIGRGERFYEIAEQTSGNKERTVQLRRDIINNLLNVTSLPQVWVAMCFAATGWANEVSNGEAQHTMNGHFHNLSELAIRLMPYERYGHEDVKGYLVLRVAVDKQNGQQKVTGGVLAFEKETAETKGSETPVVIKNLQYERQSDSQLIEPLVHDPQGFSQLLEKFSYLFDKTIQISAPILNESVRVNKGQREKSKQTLEETERLSASIKNLLSSPL